MGWRVAESVVGWGGGGERCRRFARRNSAATCRGAQPRQGAGVLRGGGTQRCSIARRSPAVPRCGQALRNHALKRRGAAETRWRGEEKQECQVAVWKLRCSDAPCNQPHTAVTRIAATRRDGARCTRCSGDRMRAAVAGTWRTWAAAPSVALSYGARRGRCFCPCDSAPLPSPPPPPASPEIGSRTLTRSSTRTAAPAHPWRRRRARPRTRQPACRRPPSRRAPT
jgi:hypothetical protein